MAYTEFKRKYLNLNVHKKAKGLPKAGVFKPSANVPQKKRPKKTSRGLLATTPAAWDWTQMGGVTPVKNQGACGSCYAFATAAAIESQVRRPRLPSACP